MDDKLSKALLKTSVKMIAETRALRDMLLMIHNNNNLEAVQFLLKHYIETSNRYEKDLYESLYAEMGDIPKDVADILNEDLKF